MTPERRSATDRGSPWDACRAGERAALRGGYPWSIDSRLSSAPLARAAHLYAESGLWYDAFDQLSSWLATERGSALLRSHRAALLEQVELGDAAAFERRGEPGDR